LKEWFVKVRNKDARSNRSDNEGEYDGSDEKEVKSPSNKEVLEALDVLKAIHHQGNNFNIQYKYTSSIFPEY